MSRGRVAFVVLGCAKNQVEAESMSSRLAQMGWEMTPDIPNASVVVVHTCGFLEAAREEATQTLRSIRKSSPRSLLVMTGCFAQYLNGKKFPGVDVLLGTGQLHLLPDVIDKRLKKAAVGASSASGYHDPSRPRPLRPGQLSAYLRISEGCNHRCTFCVIPQLRGNLRSRTPADIATEARDLVDRGVRELVVISQDTTDYGGDLSPRKSLSDLIDDMTRWPDLAWLRLLYAYPSEVNDGLIARLADNEKLLGYLDMPLQHFSDRVLKAMARDWGKTQTRKVLDKLKKRVPHLALRTTFIVGFPGETDKDFNEMLSLVEEGTFEHVGVFPYSFEKRSPSARMDGQVPSEVVDERWQRILDAHTRVKAKKDGARVGKTLDVLVETAPDGAWSARAKHQAPEVDGNVVLESWPERPGFYRAKITGVEGFDLKAALPQPRGEPRSRLLPA